MYKIFQIIVFGLFFISCSEIKENTPQENLDSLSKEELKSLLLDMYLLEGKVTEVNLNELIVRDSFLGQYKTILESHQVTENVFRNSVKYYAESDELLTILEQLDTVIQRKIDSLIEEQIKDTNAKIG